MIGFDADDYWDDAPENIVASKLYSSFGFKENGDKDGEELIAILKL